MYNLQITLKKHVKSSGLLLHDKMYPARKAVGFNMPFDGVHVLCEDEEEHIFSFGQLNRVEHEEETTK